VVATGNPMARCMGSPWRPRSTREGSTRPSSQRAPCLKGPLCTLGRALVNNVYHQLFYSGQRHAGSRRRGRRRNFGQKGRCCVVTGKLPRASERVRLGQRLEGGCRRAVASRVSSSRSRKQFADGFVGPSSRTRNPSVSPLITISVLLWARLMHMQIRHFKKKLQNASSLCLHISFLGS
jgi:hypothetical protein